MAAITSSMMPSPKGRRLLTCYHEGGHALSRWYFGFHTERVFVQTIEDLSAGKWKQDGRGRRTYAEGCVVGHDICEIQPMPTMRAHGSAVVRDHALRRAAALIHDFAGACAEAHFREIPIDDCLEGGGEGDTQHMNLLLDAWGFHGGNRWALLDAARDQAEALVQSPMGSTAIKAIADKLMERGHLSGDQVAALCRKAYGGRESRYGAWINHGPPTLEQIRVGFIP
ncbi:hypothetical protein MKK75_11020 [Methylobacterium sp. J-030]|uniref:hypothetical protein n=1 Tax=Methylobacterium sp. J-030 TaxID=2836627 RepID=UPI001FB9724F|nr:hypothetical protein [Methylobacterium sp. J-030]MCJ2069325.1 hypothetical protein [Methylobacterium sp. J-030]